MRLLTNTGDPIKTPNGDLVVGTEIKFTLVNLAKKDGLLWTASEGELLVGSTVVTTDANGEFEVNLIPNDEVTPSSAYLCEIDGVGNFTATLEGGATPKRWVDFFRQQ